MTISEIVDYGVYKISTHTLTWSVTLCIARATAPENFNSHAHVERDKRTLKPGKFVWNFNSHAHVERDPPVFAAIAATEHFNSHAHVERDSVHCATFT